ncbi:putative glucan endo-1,3-beta-D-glucosidase [Helianthus anomalus]
MLSSVLQQLHQHHFTTLLLHISALLLLTISPLFATAIGINYGQIANNLPSPQQAVPLVKSTGVNKLKLYDANPTVLKAFANTGITFTLSWNFGGVTLGIGNEYLTKLQDPSAAENWIQCNVKPYLSTTKITSIAIGNEVLTSNDTSLSGCLLPALENIHSALVKFKLDQKITVTTAHSLSVMETSYPPSSGTFRTDLNGVMSPVLDFLAKTCSSFLINAYPFFAFERNPKDVSLDFVLFQPNAGVVDSGNNLRYDNMLR